MAIHAWFLYGTQFVNNNSNSQATHMPADEPVNPIIMYESKIQPYLRPGAPTKNYKRQIFETALEANKIRKMAVNKSVWS